MCPLPYGSRSAALAYNNAWANHRLLKACAGLPQAEFEATRTSFFPSLQATLNDNLTVDLFYVDGLEGGTLGHRVFDNPLPCPTMGRASFPRKRPWTGG